jgi:CHASE1-domain containing sensor protein
MSSNLSLLNFLKTRSIWQKETIPPTIVFLLGLAVATTTAMMLQNEINKVAEVEFQRAALRVSTEINHRFRATLSGLNGLKSLYSVYPEVKRAEFQAAVESRDLKKEFPGLRGFGFVERVLQKNLATFVAAERVDGAPQFTIRQLDDKDREDLFVVKFIEPFRTNKAALGLDIGSELVRRTLLQQAVDTGEPVMTNALTLV